MKFSRTTEPRSRRPRRTAEVLHRTTVETRIVPTEHIPQKAVDRFVDECQTLDYEYDNVRMPDYRASAFQLAVLMPEARERVGESLRHIYDDDYEGDVRSANAGLQEGNFLPVGIVVRDYFLFHPKPRSKLRLNENIIDKLLIAILNEKKFQRAACEALLSYVQLCERRPKRRKELHDLQRVVTEWALHAAKEPYSKYTMDCIAQCVLAFPGIWSEGSAVKQAWAPHVRQYVQEHNIPSLQVHFDERKGLDGISELCTATVLSADTVVRQPDGLFSFTTAPALASKEPFPPHLHL